MGAYRKKTLRHMNPTTRRYARILNDLDSVLRRLKNLTEDLARLEADSRALYARAHAAKAHSADDIFGGLDENL